MNVTKKHQNRCSTCGKYEPHSAKTGYCKKLRMLLSPMCFCEHWEAK